MSGANVLLLVQGSDRERESGNSRDREDQRIWRVMSTYLSCSKLSGHFDPGGNKDFSGLASSAGGG